MTKQTSYSSNFRLTFAKAYKSSGQKSVPKFLSTSIIYKNIKEDTNDEDDGDNNSNGNSNISNGSNISSISCSTRVPTYAEAESALSVLRDYVNRDGGSGDPLKKFCAFSGSIRSERLTRATTQSSVYSFFN